MERRFGADFSGVRIHADSAAARSARDVNAHAYTVGRHIAFASGRFAPDTTQGRRLLAHELTHVVQQSGATPALIQRDTGDPLAELEGVTHDTIHTIILDPSSGRTRLFASGGKTFDGMIEYKSGRFAEGEYVLEPPKKRTAERTWNIRNADGSKFMGGLQFSIRVNGVDFDSLLFMDSVALKVAGGLLPQLIDLDQRVRDIKKIVSQFRVNTKDELEIIRLLTDVPAEQAGALMAKLRAEKVGESSLLAELDSAVDQDENTALHEALTRLKIRGGGAAAVKNLAQAPVLAWHDVMGFFEQNAVFSVEPIGEGKYRIRYMGGVTGGLYSNPEFAELKDLNRRDRLNMVTGGIVVDADQPIIVHDYDSGRQVVLTAEDLIAYQHSGHRKFLEDVGTIASLATPVGAETVAGRVVVYGAQILAVATLIVDENRMNLQRWFPNWAPAIFAATEKIKTILAIVNVGQLVHGGWSVFAKLRSLRNARKVMDAKAVLAAGEDAALAERQAQQLEANADNLLSQADKARKELGVADEIVNSAGQLENAQEAAARAATGAAEKTKTIDSAISSKKFSGDFSSFVNRELVANQGRVRPSRVKGYTVEVPIEGTDHFLARKANGTWCLFSGSPTGCGAIGVAKDVDELFAQLGKELGTSKPSARIGSQARVDMAQIIADAQKEGLVGAAGEPIAVDLVLQPHGRASDARKALGQSGKTTQSAHVGPTSALKGVEGYSRSGALTVLMPKDVHKAFDQYWKDWSMAQRRAGKTHVTVDTFLGVMDKAVGQTPNLPQKTKNALSGRLFDEFYKELGLQPGDLIELPYSNIKAGAPSP